MYVFLMSFDLVNCDYEINDVGGFSYVYGHLCGYLFLHFSSPLSSLKVNCSASHHLVNFQSIGQDLILEYHQFPPL